MAKRKKKVTKGVSKVILFELYGIVIFTFSLMAMARLGAVGRSLSYLSRFFVGNWDFLLPLGGMVLAVRVMIKRSWPSRWSSRWTGIFLMILAFLIWNHMETFDNMQFQGNEVPIISTTWDLILAEKNSRLPTDIGGGMVGGLGYALFQYLFDQTGSTLATIALGMGGLLLATGFSYVNSLRSLRIWWNGWLERRKHDLIRRLNRRGRKERIGAKKEKQPVPYPSEGNETPVIHDFSENEERNALTVPAEQPELFPVVSQETGKGTASMDHPDQKKESPLEKKEPSGDMVVHLKKEQTPAEYRLPPFKILNKPKSQKTNRDRRGMADNAKILESTLESFGVRAKVTQIHRGPAVTRYEVQPDTGVKVSRIVNLSDDIALALAAKDIRIEAPIPGKAALGIEVPNSNISVVGLRDVLESSQYHEAESKLSIALGRDISGEPIVGDLSKMPHLLVAGATGSGKSVCINGIICSILYKAKPDEAKIMMIDPKMVELNIYNGIPHLLAPVVTDSRKAAVALKKVVSEMERRYELFAEHGARDIERYNQLAREKDEENILPYIVVIVDELADLMMVAAADVEDAICRLAQMARAAGIHLIIATQRPSVDVITGVIKANIPSRIAFGVSSAADSRTILDTGGAEKLLGRGDMLYVPVGASKPIRIQGSFVSDKEVEAVVQYVKGQQQAHYHEEMIPEVQPEGTDEKEVEDELFPKAVQLVVEAKTASVSLLQRRLRVGYTRAARLMDFMEQKGIVGPYEGSKPREVLMTPEQISNRKF